MASEKMELCYWDKLNNQRLFDPHEYFVKGNPARPEQAAWLSLSVEYQTRLENVKGVLTIQEECIIFMPSPDFVYKDPKTPKPLKIINNNFL